MLTSAGWEESTLPIPLSEPLHSSLGGISPPTQVLPRFCCRIGATLEIVDADDAPSWVSIELGVRKRLIRQSNAGIVPGVLRFLQRKSARDDSGPQRGPADGRLAAHVKLPTAHIAAFVDLLQSEPCGIVAGFRRMFRRMCWRVLLRRECVGGRPGCFRYHRPHQPQADGYHQALQREHEPREPDHLVLPAAVIDSLLRILYLQILTSRRIAVASSLTGRRSGGFRRQGGKSPRTSAGVLGAGISRAKT